jgi:hypothetical protein
MVSFPVFVHNITTTRAVQLGDHVPFIVLGTHLSPLLSKIPTRPSASHWPYDRQPNQSTRMIVTPTGVTPSTVINADDHGALVVISAAFCITISGLTYAARLLSRLPWRALFGYDDMVISMATVSQSLQPPSGV